MRKTYRAHCFSDVYLHQIDLEKQLIENQGSQYVETLEAYEQNGSERNSQNYLDRKGCLQ